MGQMDKKRAGQWVFNVLVVVALTLLVYSIFLPSLVVSVTLENQSAQSVRVSVYLKNSSRPHKTIELQPGESKSVKLWEADSLAEVHPKNARFVAEAGDGTLFDEASFDGKQLTEGWPPRIAITAQGRFALLQPASTPAESQPSGDNEGAGKDEEEAK